MLTEWGSQDGTASMGKDCVLEICNQVGSGQTHQQGPWGIWDVCSSPNLVS